MKHWLGASVLLAACPALADCPPGPESVDLLRNGSIVSLEPVNPPLRAIFAGVPCDPTLARVRDLEARGLSSGARFPHDVADRGPSARLVYYQLDTPTDVLRVGKTASRIVLSWTRDTATRVVLPPPGGGPMIGGARAGVMLRADGTILNWGADFGFRLGQGNAVAQDQHSPVEVHGPGNVGMLSSVRAIAAGEPFSVALADDGTVWSWGDDTFGELGIGALSVASSSTPVQVLAPDGASCLTDVLAIGSRGYHALAIDASGEILAWGHNLGGECGDGTTNSPQPLPVVVQGLPALTPVAVSGGYSYSLALMSDGTVWGWGANSRGELADGTIVSPRLAPQRVGASIGLDHVVQVSAGWGHALALRDDGTVWAWGRNDYGEIGDGTLVNATSPLEVPGPGGVGVLSGIVMVSGGDCHSAALRADGTVWTWGCNHHNGTNPPPNGSDPVGQLGNGDDTYADQPYPVEVVGGEQGGAFLHSIVMIAARDYHDYALASDGTLWSWGSNLNGQLGNGTCCLPSTSPVRVPLP